MRVKKKSPFTSIAIACAALALSGHAFALDAGPFGASLPNPALPVAAKPPGAAPAPASAQPPAGAPKPMAAASPANASIVWPSADPKGLPPAAIHGQGGECRTSRRDRGEEQPVEMQRLPRAIRVAEQAEDEHRDADHGRAERGHLDSARYRLGGQALRKLCARRIVVMLAH